jgi:DNA-directed RNA polymerase specialized sigma24 family protein
MSLFSWNEIVGLNPVETRLHASIGWDLMEYNHLVMQNQDEVFTLAVNLLGDENQASEVVQASFIEAFKSARKDPEKFRRDILSLVIRNCQKKTRVLPGPKNLGCYLSQLCNEEKIMLILVDSLELNYTEAAAIMQKSLAAVGRTVAQARVSVHLAMKASQN